MEKEATNQQAVATTFIIPKDKIVDEEILNEFREDQICQFKESEKLLIDDEAIKILTKNIDEYLKSMVTSGGEK